MNRRFALAALLMSAALFGTSMVSAAEVSIHTKNPTSWDPPAASAKVNDVVEWKIGSAPVHSHGVRITNWAAVKDHVEVETVAGQEKFDAEAGKTKNPNGTNVDGKVLLRLKIKSVLPAPGKITYNCIVHGNIMKGDVSVAQ